MDDLVMRSVYLRPSEDSQLRQLAHDLSVTKSDLIRSAISTKLKEWRESNSDERVLHDLQFGRREGLADQTARTVVAARPTSASEAAKVLPAARLAARSSKAAPKKSSGGQAKRLGTAKFYAQAAQPDD